jgi:hypothetical protein
MPCVFCKRDEALTAEHVFPRWTQPCLDTPGGGSGTYTRVTIRAGDPEPEEHSRPGKAATLTVRSVCAQCNNGWMGRLEDQARPYLLTMIRGNGRTYHATGRTLIATWFVKTALVAGSKFSPPLPHAFYEQVRATGRPSDNTRVWLAATPWNEMHYTDSARSRCTTRRNRRPTSRTPSAP